MKNASEEVKQINLQHENERIAICTEHRAEVSSERERYSIERESIMVTFHCETTDAKLENIKQRTVIESRLRELREQRFLECEGVESKEDMRPIIEKYERHRSEQKDLLACLTLAYERQKQAIYQKRMNAWAENDRLHRERIGLLLDERNRKLAAAKEKRDSLIDEVVQKYGNAEG